MAGFTQRSQIEVGWIEKSFSQMNFENIAPVLWRREIDVKDFIEAAFANHFGRQTANIVRCSDDEHRLAPFGHPSEHGAENAARESVVVVADGHALFNFIEPKNARRHDFGHFQSEAEILFRFPVVFAVKNAEI